MKDQQADETRTSRKPGRPITNEERRKRPLKHLILYGIKMMVRRDLGGVVTIQEHAEFLRDKIASNKEVTAFIDESAIREEFVGLTAAEAAKLATDRTNRVIKLAAATCALELVQLRDGIQARQKRTIEEIERRVDALEQAQVDALGIMARSHTNDPTLLRLVESVGIFLGGERSSTAAETHILR